MNNKIYHKTADRRILKIAVILPSYNEENTIANTILDFHENLPEAEIWVINNRSSDQTERIARETIQKLICSGGVINEPRPGKGSAVRRAFIDVNADIYVLADADMTYPAYQARELMHPIIENQADMVVGDRHSSGFYASENKRAFHEFGNLLVSLLVNKLFKAKLKDIMSGYRIFTKEFVKNYPIMVDGFEIETDMTLHALDKRFRILELPISYKDRPTGSVSKLNTFRDGIRVISTIFNILRHYRPFTFFGSISLIFASSSFIAGLPVLQDWISEKYIHHIPLAILATGLGIISIILGSIAIILDSIAQQNKRNFEIDLLRSKYH
nr:glycosyltransferase family 2 protein [Delftia acidovorans]